MSCYNCQTRLCICLLTPFTPCRGSCRKFSTSSLYSSSCACSMSESANSTDGEASREDLKRDLLLAHTLSLLTKENGIIPQHALPVLVSHLTEKDLMPRWVQVCVLLFEHTLL